MNLVALLSADEAKFSVRSDTAATIGFETPWHTAELRILDEAGAVLKTVKASVDGTVDVGGPEAVPAAGVAGEATSAAASGAAAGHVGNDPILSSASSEQPLSPDRGGADAHAGAPVVPVSQAEAAPAAVTEPDHVAPAT